MTEENRDWTLIIGFLTIAVAALVLGASSFPSSRE